MEDLLSLLSIKDTTPGKGRDDDVAINVSQGEYIIPADVVAFLGDGNTEAGGKVLDQYIATIREQMQREMPQGAPPRRS